MSSSEDHEPRRRFDSGLDDERDVRSLHKIAEFKEKEMEKRTADLVVGHNILSEGRMKERQ
jgi:hypothetical protein